MEWCGVSTSTAISVIAINQAAQARKAAQCVGVMDGFTHSTATVEQRQQYAECVGLLYSRADVVSPAAVGVLLIAALLGAIFGARYGRGEGMAIMAIGGVLGAMSFPLALTCGWGLWQAIKYALGVTG